MLGLLPTIIMVPSRQEEREDAPLIVLVDDYEDTRYLFGAVMKSSGLRVVEAETGGQALELVERESPDIVVTDLALPDMDGCEVTRRIKANERTRNTPVIVLSAHGSHVKVREALEAGCSMYVSKMRSPHTLVQEIRKLLDQD